MSGTAKNKLFYGDNLDVLREYIADESIDLIYLDPPFNSKRDYNLLFKTPKGMESDAQITAFEDSWHWAQQAEDEFKEIVNPSPELMRRRGANTDVAELMRALRSFLKENDMLAYLTMMCNRLLELHRVLKPTGSLYLHCDPTASHYLKLVLDGVFGKENYRCEISWQRSSAHSDVKQGMRKYGRIRDTIFWFTKSSAYTWNSLFTPYDDGYLTSEYRHVDEFGRKYKEGDLTAAKPGGDTQYDWWVKRPLNGKTRWVADLDNEHLTPRPGWAYFAARPYRGRIWAFSRSNLVEFAKTGKLVHRETGVPRLKLFADEMPGIPLQDQWDDISPASGGEYLGYPTQKPLALLERIISASSNKGDVVLDPFCGCGTAVHAAEKLNRRWIGIDITHLSVSLIEKRMKQAFPKLAEKGAFEIIGTPQDFEAAKDLAERDKYQFQFWACTLVGAQPYKGGKKGADGGVDGIIYAEVGKNKTEKILVSVKGGANIGNAMIRDLQGAMDREKAIIGIFITLTQPTKPMITQAASAGHYESELFPNMSFPKVQILSIQDLLNGNARAVYPDLSMGGQTFKVFKATAKKQKANATSRQRSLI
jgi:DNA modification methylase